MNSTIDMLEVGAVFATTVNDATWTRPATVRLWRIDIHGAPEEITKENTK